MRSFALARHIDSNFYYFPAPWSLVYWFRLILFIFFSSCDGYKIYDIYVCIIFVWYQLKIHRWNLVHSDDTLKLSILCMYACANISHYTIDLSHTFTMTASQPASPMSLPRLAKSSEHVDNNKQQQSRTYWETEKEGDIPRTRRGPKSFLGFSKRQRFLYSHLTPHATPTEMHVKSSCLFSPISSFFHFILWYSNFSHRRFMCTHTNTHLNAYTCAVKVNSQMIMWSWQCSMPRIARSDTLAHTQQFSRGFDQRIMKWEKRMIIEKKVRTHAHERRDGITSINKSVTVCWHEQLNSDALTSDIFNTRKGRWMIWYLAETRVLACAHAYIQDGAHTKWAMKNWRSRGEEENLPQRDVLGAWVLNVFPVLNVDCLRYTRESKVCLCVCEGKERKGKWMVRTSTMVV